MRVDVHQHLWSDSLCSALRERRESPRMSGDTLILDGEPDFTVGPELRDPGLRAEAIRAEGLDLALICPSSPLGIEWLPPEEAAPLLDAYHQGVVGLPDPFRAWAAAGLVKVDPDCLAGWLDRGCVGLQVPATALLDAAGYDNCAPLLDLLHRRNKPLFIHPGAAPPAGQLPAWWPAVVPYVAQMHAAWYAFRTYGRPRYPDLRVCFAMLSGLAPLHGERFIARGGTGTMVDPLCFLDTSSYGPRAIDATLRVLGVDVLVYGSDRPYAASVDSGLDPAARHALFSANPIRLLTM